MSSVYSQLLLPHSRSFSEYKRRGGLKIIDSGFGLVDHFSKSLATTGVYPHSIHHGQKGYAYK